MEFKVVCFLIGRAMTAMSLTFLLPILYALEMRKMDIATFFAEIEAGTLIAGIILLLIGRNHRQRIQIKEAAVSMVLIWIVLAVVGALPFIMTQWLNPIDAYLESVSDLTATGISLLPPQIHYALRVWQATLMWFGSLVFLVILVTLLPIVNGSFGISLSLSQGQIFSPMFGQMKDNSRRITILYVFITIISFISFKLAGLHNWNAIIMAMKCISTGGGNNFFPGNHSHYVEYAAIFSMLLACGNFLLYFRLLKTLTPPVSSLNLQSPIKIKNFAKSVHSLIINFIERLRQNFLVNLDIFYGNSEVQFMNALIFIVTGFGFFNLFNVNMIQDGNLSFRLALFHVVSFISTTGLMTADVSDVDNFSIFILILLPLIGGCMGSVTGGLKIIRILILFKITKLEILRSIHPRMITNIKINGVAVPMKIVGRVLSFFFLFLTVMFLFSVILSLSGQPLSTSVAMSFACLTNIGALPELCETSAFMALPAIMKLFCCFILIIGRVEIFVILILIAMLFKYRKQRKW